MTIRIDQYEIEIKAKDVEIFERKNFNKRDTENFLNHLIDIMGANSDRAEKSEQKNCEYWARKSREIEHAIYDELDAAGYYNNYK